MKKISLTLVILSIFSIIYSQNNTKSQKNRYSIGLIGSYMTSGDRWGFHFANEYRKEVMRNFGFGIHLGILYSANESSIMMTVPDYPSNIITGDWMQTNENGTKILKTKTDQQTYIHSDILVNYSASIGKLEFTISAGGSISYISNSYLTRWELGTFYGMNGNQNLQLYYPYYSRIVDLGIVSKISIGYRISERLSIGFVGGINNYFKSGYRFYDLGPTMEFVF